MKDDVLMRQKPKILATVLPFVHAYEIVEKTPRKSSTQTFQIIETCFLGRKMKNSQVMMRNMRYRLLSIPQNGPKTAVFSVFCHTLFPTISVLQQKRNTRIFTVLGKLHFYWPSLPHSSCNLNRDKAILKRGKNMAD